MERREQRWKKGKRKERNERGEIDECILEWMKFAVACKNNRQAIETITNDLRKLCLASRLTKLLISFESWIPIT